MVKFDTLNVKWIQRIVITWGLAMVGGLIYIHASQLPYDIFDFRFNGYALISLISVLVNIVFASYVIIKRDDFKSSEITWYLLFLYAIILFGLFEMLQRLSANPNGAIYWAALSGIGPAFEGIGLLLFALQYTRPNVKMNATIPILIICSAILYFYFGNGNTIFINTIEATKKFPWGYNNDFGNAIALDIAWVIGLAAIAVGIMARFRSMTQNIILKKQAKIFVIALSIPILGGILFDSLAPVIGLHAPPLADFFSVATAGLMLYGLSHYKFFKVTPASMSLDILSTMTESVLVTDKELRIQLMNKSAKKLFGDQEQEDADVTLLELFGPKQAPDIKEAIEKVMVMGDKHVIGNYILSQEKKIYVRITAAKITEEQGVEGFVFAITDVSELQNSYDALENEKKSVDKKVADRTKELQEAQEKIAETDKIKTEFVILTSHNLRTPLTSIRGVAEELGEVKLDKLQTGMVKILQKSSKRLGDLVEELLTISKIEAGDNQKFEEINIKQLIQPIIEEANDLAKTTGNKFSANIESNVMILANPSKLKTAIHNLLDNAFKFTKNGEVTLNVKTENKKVKISIADTGIGVKAQEVPMLFTKFHRGTSVMQYDYEGEGIGLYLAKLIVEEHKGQLKVESEVGIGTTFTIILDEA